MLPQLFVSRQGVSIRIFTSRIFWYFNHLCNQYDSINSILFCRFNGSSLVKWCLARKCDQDLGTRSLPYHYHYHRCDLLYASSSLLSLILWTKSAIDPLAWCVRPMRVLEFVSGVQSQDKILYCHWRQLLFLTKRGFDRIATGTSWKVIRIYQCVMCTSKHHNLVPSRPAAASQNPLCNDIVWFIYGANCSPSDQLDTIQTGPPHASTPPKTSTLSPPLLSVYTHPPFHSPPNSFNDASQPASPNHCAPSARPRSPGW